VKGAVRPKGYTCIWTRKAQLGEVNEQKNRKVKTNTLLCCYFV